MIICWNKEVFELITVGKGKHLIDVSDTLISISDNKSSGIGLLL